ncbi:hypothetical protein SKUN_001357 [Spiroplasma kunkelii CR2-3x]|uniref:Uncharacterized protein n=1 Tax=Spiroplasma kunkelii CR2-3x TaxID=273035 RepID=A0A0K2JI06_SPIKU|nr:hypothetical protein [Spiroplasma kunkelii]ALA98224.1 hypothetical protein SKUN_001357 [Spiroplasma kunkelii CR2-3x]
MEENGRYLLLLKLSDEDLVARIPFYTLAETRAVANNKNKNGCLTTIIDLETIELQGCE